MKEATTSETRNYQYETMSENVEKSAHGTKVVSKVNYPTMGDGLAVPDDRQELMT